MQRTAYRKKTGTFFSRILAGHGMALAFLLALFIWSVLGDLAQV